MTAPDIRTIIALPKTDTAALKRRRIGQRVEVLPVPADTQNQISVRILDGDEAGVELWLHPTLLKLPEIETSGW